MKTNFIFPDGSEMLKQTPYYVAAARDFYNPHNNELMVRKGHYVRALRMPNEDGTERIDLCIIKQTGMGLWIGCFYQGAKLNVDFRMCELSELPYELLEWKLNKMIEIENYELASEIKREISKRDSLTPANPQFN